MINGKRVKQLREEAGLSLAGLAAQITVDTGKTVSRQALAAVEAGAYDLSVEKTVALAQALGVGIGDIVREPAKVG